MKTKFLISMGLLVASAFAQVTTKNGDTVVAPPAFCEPLSKSSGSDLGLRLNTCYSSGSFNTVYTDARGLNKTNAPDLRSGVPVWNVSTDPFASINRAGRMLLGAVEINTTKQWNFPQLRYSLEGMGSSASTDQNTVIRAMSGIPTAGCKQSDGTTAMDCAVFHLGGNDDTSSSFGQVVKMFKIDANNLAPVDIYTTNAQEGTEISNFMLAGASKAGFECDTSALLGSNSGCSHFSMHDGEISPDGGLAGDAAMNPGVTVGILLRGPAGGIAAPNDFHNMTISGSSTGCPGACTALMGHGIDADGTNGGVWSSIHCERMSGNCINLATLGSVTKGPTINDISAANNFTGNVIHLAAGYVNNSGMFLNIRRATTGTMILDDINNVKTTFTGDAQEQFYAPGTMFEYAGHVAIMNSIAPVMTNSTGTAPALNKLVKLTGAPSTVTIATTADTSGAVIGICQTASCGINAASTTTPIAVVGIASCVFDGATTAGNWVIVSTTTNGDCHDTGSAAVPATTLTTIGHVLSTNVGAGTYKVWLQVAR